VVVFGGGGCVVVSKQHWVGCVVVLVCFVAKVCFFFFPVLWFVPAFSTPGGLVFVVFHRLVVVFGCLRVLFVFVCVCPKPKLSTTRNKTAL